MYVSLNIIGIQHWVMKARSSIQSLREFWYTTNIYKALAKYHVDKLMFISNCEEVILCAVCLIVGNISGHI